MIQDQKPIQTEGLNTEYTKEINQLNTQENCQTGKQKLNPMKTKGGRASWSSGAQGLERACD